MLCRVYFVNEVVRIYDQGNEGLINRSGRSVQEYIELGLFCTSLRSVNIGKAAGNIFLHSEGNCKNIVSRGSLDVSYFEENCRYT